MDGKKQRYEVQRTTGKLKQGQQIESEPRLVQFLFSQGVLKPVDDSGRASKKKPSHKTTHNTEESNNDDQ